MSNEILLSLLLNLAPKLKYPDKCNTKIQALIRFYMFVFIYKKFLTRI